MKTILKVAIVLLSVFAGMIAFSLTGNFIALTLASYVTSWILQILTQVHLSANAFPGLFNTLAAMKRTASGTPNPGGGRKVWIAAAEHFDGDWGHTATNGEISTAPTFEEGFGFVELEVSDNSLKLDQALKGAVGYQSFETAFDLKIAGDTKDQTLAVEKLINTEVVAVFQSNDLKRKTVGSTIFPLTFEINHTTGGKGSDQKGWTLKAKQDGIPRPSFFLADSVTLPMQPTT